MTNELIGAINTIIIGQH